ncbi:hypothetical protein [Kitasatospora sp. NPDC059803]|uniref:hypothetical protein n=1 Tax=Kitasatospora sp. NPDC059803 TaxID=3346953 RepID=UPI00365076AB
MSTDRPLASTLIDRIVDYLLPLAVPIGDLTRYHRNPRRDDVAAVAESFRIHGRTMPTIVAQGVLIGRSGGAAHATTVRQLLSFAVWLPICSKALNPGPVAPLEEN